MRSYQDEEVSQLLLQNSAEKAPFATLSTTPSAQVATLRSQ
jgi:hypothetical protein